MRLKTTSLSLAAAALVGALLAAGTASAQQAELLTYCKADIERLCKTVPPGEGRLLACLRVKGGFSPASSPMASRSASAAPRRFSS